MSTLPDTGARSTFSTGAVRDAMEGKGLPSCIPPIAIRKMAKRFEDGMAKYGLHNWVKGIPLSRYIDSATRHLLDFQEGNQDEDHLGAILWNVACLAWTEQAIKDGRLPADLDDLPFRSKLAKEEPPPHEFDDFILHDGLERAFKSNPLGECGVEMQQCDRIYDGMVELPCGGWAQDLKSELVRPNVPYRLYDSSLKRITMDLGDTRQTMQDLFKWDASRKCFINEVGVPVENVAYFA